MLFSRESKKAILLSSLKSFFTIEKIMLLADYCEEEGNTEALVLGLSFLAKAMGVDISSMKGLDKFLDTVIEASPKFKGFIDEDRELYNRKFKDQKSKDQKDKKSKTKNDELSDILDDLFRNKKTSKQIFDGDVDEDFDEEDEDVNEEDLFNSLDDIIKKYRKKKEDEES